MNALLLFITTAGLIIALWVLPANCEDVPGPVRFVSELAKNLVLTFLRTAAAIVVIIVAVGLCAIAAIAFLCWLVIWVLCIAGALIFSERKYRG